MELDPQIVFFAVVTMAVGYLMVVGGIGKSGLEWRRPRARLCPSCGRLIQARVCKCAGGA